MGRSQALQTFQNRVVRSIDLARVTELTKKLKTAGRKASEQDRSELAANLAHVAFLAPDQVAAVYDAVSEAWLEDTIRTEPIATLKRPPEPAPAGLWNNFWSVVEDAADGKLDALGITQRTAALGGAMPPSFVARVSDMSFTYPGIAEAAAGDLPAKIDLETLAQQPEHSLGEAFYRLIVDNKFDLEVLDRAEIGLAELPPPLDYLNTRILQAHDLWHITAGYETTALHEIALSAFQMAQFGHNYSAQFLSIVAAVGAITPASGYGVLMDTITTAWAHGRETQPMMLIPWEEVWHKSAEDIRIDFNITPYNRPHPADLIEKTAPVAAFRRKVVAVLRAFRPRRATPV
ncbi:MAG: Coq4 family protein [Henriciella sp.]|nr:Coq4 family protein [Henriciella sp.]